MNKMKKIFCIAMMLAICSLFLVGCVEDTSNLAKEEGVDDVELGETFFYEVKFTEQNQQRLVKATPPPKLTKSLERENLARRYEFLNDENKIFYVYLVSYGKVMAFYTAKGKISSVNSRITQEEQIIRGPYGYSDGNKNIVVGSPQLDGSYGTNGDGIFFFTTEGAYVEWNGEYMVSDYPLKLSTPPALVRQVE